MGFFANDNVNEATVVKRICLSLSGLQKHQLWKDCFERKRLFLSKKKITRIVAF